MNLQDLCVLIVDCEHKTAPTQDTGYPSIRTPNIGRGFFILDGVNRVSEETYRLWTRRAIPQPGDLIMAREAPVGNVAIIPPGLQPCLGQRTLLIRPDCSKVDPSFLNYFLNGPHVQGLIRAKTNGVTVAHLNMEDVRTMELPELPPLSTQRRTAEILSAYDDLIENNARRMKILEQMAQMLCREWFVKFRFPGDDKVNLVDSEIGPIPRGWTASTVGNLCDDVRRSVNPSDVPSETPYIGLEHMPRKSIALSEWGEAGQVQSTKLRFNRGDILFGKIRPYFHKVGTAPINGVCSSDAIVIVPKEQKYSSVVLLCASSDDFVAQATQTSQGTKMPRANWSVLARYPIAIPDVPLLERFNAIVVPMIELLTNLIFRNRCLRKTRDLLLPKLMSGEISIENIETEVPAQAI